MSVRDERIKFFANDMNIASGGSLVAALVTEPFTGTTTGKSSSLSQANFVLTSFVLSAFFILPVMLRLEG